VKSVESVAEFVIFFFSKMPMEAINVEMREATSAFFFIHPREQHNGFFHFLAEATW